MGLDTKAILDKAQAANKFSHGHVLVLSGGVGKTGAARLAARGALRIGAGLVTIGCPRNALSEIASQVTSIMCIPLDGAPGLVEFLTDPRINALCLGPGLGLGADTQALVLAALESKRKTVLDADALSRFERFPDVLFGAAHKDVVITPHAGEFQRLFPDLAEKLNENSDYSKLNATRDAAARAGCTVLFKGASTTISDASGATRLVEGAKVKHSAWLATAGSGDVLAGFIAGLLGRGLPGADAAELGAILHLKCANSFGPGLIAEDLPEELPKVISAMGL